MPPRPTRCQDEEPFWLLLKTNFLPEAFCKNCLLGTCVHYGGLVMSVSRRRSRQRRDLMLREKGTSW